MARGRRAWGEGSIYRREDGYWVAALWVERPDGSRKRRTRSAASQAVALERLGELREEAKRAWVCLDERQTVAQFVEWWVEQELAAQVAEGQVTETTRGFYAGKMRRYVVPHVGDVQLRRLSGQHVRTMLRTLRAAGCSQDLVAKVHQSLGVMLQSAVQLDLVGENVARRAKARPAPPRPRPRVPTVEEAQRILGLIEDDRWEALWLTGMGTAMRPGEVLGLGWPDVDLDQAQATVRGNLVRHDRRWALHDTKAHKERGVSLPAQCVVALRAHRRRQLEERLASPGSWAPARLWSARRTRWVEVDLVFSRPSGTPLYFDHVADALSTICWKARVPRMTPHQLFRHGGASLMLAKGVDVYTLKEVLGHSTIAVTELYSQVMAEAKRDAAKRMDEVLKGGLRRLPGLDP